MYQAGRRIVSHHKRHIFLGWFAVFIILLAVGGVVYIKYFLKSDTVIGTPPAPKVGNVSDGTGKTKTFNETGFTVKLPVDWKLLSHKTGQYNIYAWENTSKDPGPGVQQMQIYYDTIPSNLGVNRVMPVQSDGDQVVPNDVSPNCHEFTNGKVPGNEETPSKYGDVNFLCDLSNYERDVVGTSSSAGVNMVKVVGPHTGAHRIFFTYTDNGPTPDFTIFTNAVHSYTQK